MKRRKFINNLSITSVGLFSANSLFAHNYNFQKNKFKLKYAPHLGMFANSAGKDPIDQLSFMADQGFMALRIIE